MYDVMQGVKVVEVAEHTFVPAAAMVLADWGAEVIKVERVDGGGDASRHMKAVQRPGLKANPFFEAANRGKRGLALDLTRAEGRELLYQLVAQADVFSTNMRDDARAKLGIEPDDLFKVNPRLIYASGTGYGKHGPIAAARGFDMPSSWTRSGSAFIQTPQNGIDPPPFQPGSVGDLCGGATLAGAIAAALFRRERTGKGAVIDHSLYLIGIYIMSQSIIASSMGGVASGRQPHRSVTPDPLANWYQTKDGRWLLMMLLYPQWWQDFARHIGREEWLSDPRYDSDAARAANNVEMIADLDAVFAQRTLAEWEAHLAGLQGVWAPAKSPDEVIVDPQALENGYVTRVDMSDGQHYLAGAAPAQFDGRAVGQLRAAPNHGEHTDAVMRELGLTDQQIADLRASGIVG